MTNTVNDSMVWHNDGHAIHLRLEKSTVSVVDVECPGVPECQHDYVGCLVKFFAMRFGLECNVGIADPAGRMGIAWTVVGDPRDIDLCQVWIIPIDDEAFAAWLMTVDVSPQPEDDQ